VEPGPEANHPPVGVFEVRPTLEGPAPLAVRFFACDSRDRDGDPLRFRFETGEADRASNVTGFCQFPHVYEKPGLYQAVLCVSDRIDQPGHEVCGAFEVEVYAPAGAPPARVYSHAIGYAACPTGAAAFSDHHPIRSSNAAQALLACEACMGRGACQLDLADCAGPAYGDPSFEPAGDRPRWGFDAGCSGPAGRVFRAGDSTVAFGRWAQ
jgi:hypothetical protein